MSLLLCYHYTDNYTEVLGTFIIYTVENGVEQIDIPIKSPKDYTVGMVYRMTPDPIRPESNPDIMESFMKDKRAVDLYNKRYKYKAVSADMGCWLTV